MTAPERTQPTPAAQPEVGLSDSEREALLVAVQSTLGIYDRSNERLYAAVEKIIAAHIEVARAAGVVKVLEEAERRIVERSRENNAHGRDTYGAEVLYLLDQLRAESGTGEGADPGYCFPSLGGWLTRSRRKGGSQCR